MRPMSDKEIRKLRRIDLLELLIEECKENKRLKRESEQLKQELQKAKKQLQSKRIAIKEAGSIAEASLRLSGVFEAAQDAANVYLANVKKLAAAQEGGSGDATVFPGTGSGDADGGSAGEVSTT